MQSKRVQTIYEVAKRIPLLLQHSNVIIFLNETKKISKAKPDI